MWYLIVWITGAYAPSIAIIPEKYPTEEACHAAAKSDRWSHSCIPAPLKNETITIPNLQGGGIGGGYYCGQYPEKCKIKE